MHFRIIVWVLLMLLIPAAAAVSQQKPVPKPSTPRQSPRPNDEPANTDSPASRGKRGSRIIDDTTKQIYGPNTSKYYYEQDVFYNRNIVHPIDTLIRNFHRFNYVQRYSNYYQDLGNIGTAIRPVFYEEPSVMGARSGLDAYNLYWDTEEIRYFDTKSPYSNMNVILGGKGRSMTRATFSRNITPRWNFGINYRGWFIDKQVPERSGKGDRVTRSNYYDLFSSFYTKDSVYRVFANFKRIYHKVEESGGVRLDPEDSSFQAYFDPNLRVWLTAAESHDLRMNVHFNHQFKVGKALQVYHTFDRYRQEAKFLDHYPTDQDFFPYQRLEGDSTRDVGKFKDIRNEIGLKGNLLKLFYNGYVARRHLTMTYDNWTLDSTRSEVTDENYIGGRIELNIDSIGLVNGWAEVNNLGHYRVEGTIQSRWFDGFLKQNFYAPSYVVREYPGTHHIWDNNNSFANTQSSQLGGAIHYRSTVLRLSPGVTFTRLKNYIFFKHNPVEGASQVVPVQSSGNQIYVSPEMHASFTFFRNINFVTQATYTSFIENADKALRLPEFFVNAQISYSNIHFDGNLDMHTGIDVHWRSAYYAPAYDPALRQFYNQDFFEMNAFPVIDIFLNAKIKRARIFLKWNNFVEVIRETGYFATPTYPGQKNIIDFGFDWSFYD